MKDLLKASLAAVVATMFSVATASAVDGVSFGVVGNMTDFTTDGEERERCQTSADASIGACETNKGSGSGSADFPSLFIEYTGSAESGPLAMTFGIEYIPTDEEIGKKSRTDTRSDSKEDSDDSGTYTAKGTIKNHAAVYLEPTIAVSDTIGVFVKGGITHVTVETNESIAKGADSSQYGNESVFGTTVGAGIRVNLVGGLLLKAEWLDTDYGNIELTSATGNKNTIEANPESQSTRISLGWTF